MHRSGTLHHRSIVGMVLAMALGLLAPLLMRDAHAAPFAYIPSFNGNSISVVDLATNAVIKSIPVGVNPLEVFVNASNTRVYVTNKGSNSVSVIDTATHSVVATIGGLSLASSIVGNAAGTRLYVSSYSSVTGQPGGPISVVDTTSNTIIGTIPAANAAHLVINPAGTRIYVVCACGSIGGQTVLRVIDTNTNTVLAPIVLFQASDPGGGVGGNIAVSRDGARLYVPLYRFGSSGSPSTGFVRVYDASTNASIGSFVAGSAPYGVVLNTAGTRLYVTDGASGNVLAIDTGSGAVVATIPVGPHPAGIAISADDSRVAAVNSGSDSVSIINTANNAVMATVTVPSPTGLAGFIGPGAPGALVSTPPVFPVTTTATITPTTAIATADFQPRPQDVGTSAKVYVFAHAPSHLVRGVVPAKRQREPIPGVMDSDAIVCVVAQVDASGQLFAVNAATMREFLNGVLSSQVRAVTLLNNVPTPNVAGATLFVGYGASAEAMLTNSNYQTALSVAGPVQCSSSLESAPAPKSPGVLTGLWWNATEGGWGIQFTQRGGLVFGAWYTYDAAGNPIWYVSPNCAMTGAVTATSGACSGTLYQVAGTGYYGTTPNPGRVTASAVGVLQVTFRDAANASMSYTVAGQNRTVAITRQPVGTSGTVPAVDYSDLWWNPNESGWGMAIAHQSSNMFLAWYVYDGFGNPTWFVASNCVVSGSGCTGALYRTTGPAFGPAFDSRRVQVFAAGSVIVSFIDANNAVLSYTLNGVVGTKAMTRQLFGP